MISQNPFVGPGPTEVHLPHSPLVNVLCQIRFPAIASLEKKDFIAPFQEAIRHQYPKLVQDQGIELSFTPQGGGFTHKVIWRMFDRSQSRRVSVGDNFVSLETTSYPGRTQFLEALGYIVEKMQQTIQPGLVERIGLRYINQITCTNRSRLSELLEPEVVGIAHDNLGDHLTSTFSETRFTVSNTITVNGKWGLLPKGQSYDPTVLPPIDEQSWVLDFDAISEDSVDFSVNAIAPIVGNLTDTDYRLFRSTVTDAFLKEYGGTQ